MEELNLQKLKNIIVILIITASIAILFLILDDFSINLLKSYACLLIIIATMILCGVLVKKKNVLKRKTIIQLFVTSLYIEIFMFSAAFSELSQITRIKNVVGLTVSSSILLFTTVLIWIQKLEKEVNFRKKVAENVYLLIPLFFSLVIRLPQLGTPIRWDAQVYYDSLQKACQNFDFSFEAFSRLRLVGHPTMGYASWLAIFEFLMPDNPINIGLSNLILSLIIVFAVYRILQYFYKKQNIILSLSCMVVCTTPIFMGTFAYYHMDFGICIFFILFVFFHLYEYTLLQMISGLFLLQSKEVGIILLGGYVAGYLLISFLQKKGNIFQRGFVLIKSKENLFMIFLVIVGGVYILLSMFGILNGWKMTDSSGNVMSNINYFSLEKEYFIHKLKQIFILNFQWITTGIFLVTSIVLLFRKKLVDREKVTYIGAIIAGIVAYILFSLIYVTYPLPRYNIVTMVVLNLLTIIFLNIVLNLKKVIVTFEVLLLGLFLVEGYFTIDPLSIHFFDNLKTGSIPLLNTSLNSNYIGDYCVYNYQYSYLDKGIEKILKSLDRPEEYVILVNNCGDDLYLGGNKAFSPIYWDTKEKKWVYKENKDTIILNEGSMNLKTSEEFPSKILVIDIPYYMVDDSDDIWIKKVLNEKYKLKEEKQISIGLYGKMQYRIYTYD